MKEEMVKNFLDVFLVRAQEFEKLLCETGDGKLLQEFEKTLYPVYLLRQQFFEDGEKR